MKTFAVLSVASFIITSVDGCAYGTTLMPRAEGVIEEPKFGYSGAKGPLNWASLTSDNALCNTGTTQSPIDLTSSSFSMDSGAAYVINSADTPGSEFENLGTTVEVLVNGTLSGALGEYSMNQFHFHTPSEHHINGEYFPMESHFVFQKAGMFLATELIC
jgi:carbonic anhydrase